MLAGIRPDSWLLLRSKTSRKSIGRHWDGRRPISWLSFRIRCVSPTRESNSEGTVPQMREPTEPLRSSFVTRLSVRNLNRTSPNDNPAQVSMRPLQVRNG